MKKHFICGIVYLVLIAAAFFAVAAEQYDRTELGNKMVHQKWCTEEFYTQMEFHNILHKWQHMYDVSDVNMYDEYEVVNGGSAWYPKFGSPSVHMTFFLRTKKRSSETDMEAKKRLRDAVAHIGVDANHEDAERWWVHEKNGTVSYLIAEH